MLNLLLAQTETSEAYEMGRKAGQIVGLAFCAGLVALAAVILIVGLRRPRANRKAVLSTGLLIGSWGVMALIAAAVRGTVGPVSALAMGGGMFVCLLLSPALAVWGLVEIGNRRGEFSSGKGYAITSLVLGSLMLAGVIVAAGVGFVSGVRKARMREESAAAVPPQEFPDLGYRLQPPSRPWISVEPKRLNALATSAYMRTRPTIYFMVIAEKLESGTSISLDAAAGVVKANIASGSTQSEFLEEGPETLQGLEGHKIVVRARVNNLDLAYRYWIHVTPGNVYQLMIWGPAADKEAVLAEADKVFPGFKLLPPPANPPEPEPK